MIAPTNQIRMYLMLISGSASQPARAAPVMATLTMNASRCSGLAP